MTQLGGTGFLGSPRWEEQPDLREGGGSVARRSGDCVHTWLAKSPGTTGRLAPGWARADYRRLQVPDLGSFRSEPGSHFDSAGSPCPTAHHSVRTLCSPVAPVDPAAGNSRM